MRSIQELNFMDFQETVKRALKKLSIADITANSDLGKWAVEFLKLEQELVDLQQKPINVTGLTEDAWRQVLEHREKLTGRKQRQSELLSKILSEAATIFGEGLVAHLTEKKGKD